MTQAERMLETARQYSTGTYVNRFVAPAFQKMIRAEAGASRINPVSAVVDGNITLVRRPSPGDVVCVTCGKVGQWASGLGGMHTGHFLASRRHSILFEEMNVAPQCSRCNRYESGAPERFRMWMEAVRPEHIERLERLKNTVRQFTREELVEMLVSYRARLKAAERIMRGG